MKRLWRKISQLIMTETGQVVFSVLVLILVPVIVVLNMYSAIQAAERDVNVALLRKSMMSEQLMAISVRPLLNDQATLQAYIMNTANQTDDIWGADVFVPDHNMFRVVASTDPSTIGKLYDETLLSIAWSTGDVNAHPTYSASRSTLEAVAANNPDKKRFWVAQARMTSDTGDKIALLGVKMSSDEVDQITWNSRYRLIFYLIVSISLVIMLLMLNGRMFQYAVLFQKLKEVDQMKDEFISIASHELRTPITGIRGYLDMVLAGDFGTIPDPAKGSLRMVLSSAERLNGLVEDLLNVSRIEQGRLDLKLEAVDPHPVITEVIAELMPLAAQKQLVLSYKGPDHLPPISVNRDRFKQVVINLTGNGIKYTPHGSVAIQAEERDHTFRLTVADTGLGMSPKGMERLFTKFYRVQTDQTHDIPGTGLGLWITKQIIEKMGGTIEVESIEGVGSQFIVVFPTIAHSIE